MIHSELPVSDYGIFEGGGWPNPVLYIICYIKYLKIMLSMLKISKHSCPSKTLMEDYQKMTIDISSSIFFYSQQGITKEIEKHENFHPTF